MVQFDQESISLEGFEMFGLFFRTYGSLLIPTNLYDALKYDFRMPASVALFFVVMQVGVMVFVAWMLGINALAWIIHGAMYPKQLSQVFWAVLCYSVVMVIVTIWTVLEQLNA